MKLVGQSSFNLRSSFLSVHISLLEKILLIPHTDLNQNIILSLTNITSIKYENFKDNQQGIDREIECSKNLHFWYLNTFQHSFLNPPKKIAIKMAFYVAKLVRTLEKQVSK